MEEETSEDSKIEKHGNDGSSKGGFIYRVGKKIVITGAVISSAPFVLPPLLVASTLGFAFAVPFGLVYASYACTNKVMSKLLSRPEGEMIEQEVERGGLERDEEEFEEDVKRRLEMRLDLIGDESGEREVGAEDGKQLGGGGARGFDQKEEAVDYKDGMVEENGGYDYIEEDEKLEGGQGNKGVVAEYAKEDGLGGGNIVMGGMAERKGDFDDKEEEELIDDGHRETEELEGYDGNLVEEAVGETDVQQKERLVRDVNEFMGDENVEEREIPVADTFGSVEDKEEPSKLMEAGEEGYRYDENVDKAGDEHDMKGEMILDGIEPMKEEETVEEVKRPEEVTSDNVEAEKKLVRTDDGEEAVREYGMSKALGNEEMPKEVTGKSVEETRNEVIAEIPVEETVEVKKPEEETSDNTEAEKNLVRTDDGEEAIREYGMNKSLGNEEMPKEVTGESVEETRNEVIAGIPVEETVEEVKKPEEETPDNIEAEKKLERTDDGEEAVREYGMNKSLGNEEMPKEVTGESVEATKNEVIAEIPEEEETVEEVKKTEEETPDNIEAEKKSVRTDDGEEAIREYGMNKSLGNEEMPKEVTGESVEETRNVVIAEIPGEEETPLGGAMEGVDENDYMENKVVGEKIEANGGVKGIGKERSNDKKMDEMEKEEQPLVIEVKEIVEDRRIRAIDDSMVEEETPIVEVKVVKVVSLQENAREIADESGLDLFDEQSETSAHYDSEIDEGEVSVVTELQAISRSREVDFEPQHVISEPSSAIKEPMSDTMGDESVDSSVHPDSSERMESADSSIQLVPSEVMVGPVDSAAVVEINIPSKEVLYTEEKIWELMDAMRKIVGYKGAKQPDISEELKALYMFTGVEPPVGFKDPLDIVEVNDKLRLLMAIIGVK